MDQKGTDCVIDPTANQTQNSYLKKTLQFVFPISIISFLVSYFSVLSIIFHQLHSSAIFTFLAHALDRKCMFLLCNGILAFLANNMKLNLNYGGFLKRFDEEDGHDEHLPQMLLFQENAASMEYVDHTPLDDAVSEEKEIQDDDGDEDEDRENEMLISLESEEWGEEEEEDDDDEVEENAGVDDTSSVNDMRVSTEELNKKFDEFIRKMKEGIRIEAQQQYVILV